MNNSAYFVNYMFVNDCLMCAMPLEVNNIEQKIVLMTGKLCCP